MPLPIFRSLIIEFSFKSRLFEKTFL